MAGKSNLNHESSAVQKHLEIMQGVIQRMAENSRSCKLFGGVDKLGGPRARYPA